MEINKISSSTPDVYKVENYLSYYRIKDEHIVIIDETLAKVFSNSDYEAINNHIFETWDTVSCYNVEDRGDYWEFIEVDEENCKYDYEPDEEDEKVDRYEEVRRIEGLIAKAIDDKEPQPFGNDDAYEIDIEYMEEENHNLFEAAVVLKYCNNPERYFPLKDIYNNISTVLKGEEDDILYHIADQIYTYYYGEENNIEEE